MYYASEHETKPQYFDKLKKKMGSNIRIHKHQKDNTYTMKYLSR